MLLLHLSAMDEMILISYLWKELLGGLFTNVFQVLGYLLRKDACFYFGK